MKKAKRTGVRRNGAILTKQLKRTVIASAVEQICAIIGADPESLIKLTIRKNYGSVFDGKGKALDSSWIFKVTAKSK